MSRIQEDPEIIFNVQKSQRIQKSYSLPRIQEDPELYSLSRNPRIFRSHIRYPEIPHDPEVTNPRRSKSCHYREINKLPSIHDSHNPVISSCYPNPFHLIKLTFCSTFKPTFIAQEHRSPVMPVVEETSNRSMAIKQVVNSLANIRAL